MRIAVILFCSALTAQAQSFQPPSWGQPLPQEIDRLKQQLQQLMSKRDRTPDTQKQLDLLRQQLNQDLEKQRKLNSPAIVAQDGPVVTGHPFSGKETRHTTQTLANGNAVEHTDTSYFYRDAEGRMRAEGTGTLEILDPVAHAEYDIDNRAKTYTKHDLSASLTYASVAAYGNGVHVTTRGGTAGSAPPQTGVTDELGKQLVNGLEARGSRVTITIPAGAIGNDHEIKVVNERWYSETLQALVRSVNNDPRFGISEYNLTNISLTPPNASLFTLPSDYRSTP